MMKNKQFAEQRAKIEYAKRNLWGYCMAMAPDFYNENYLEEICDAIQEFENDDNELLIINCPPRSGKKLANETPVLTTKGWKKHGDLKIGDYVYNQFGLPVKVVNVLPKTSDFDYKVKFVNGEEIIAHHNHEWIIYDRNARKLKKIETYYMLDKIDNGIEHKRGHRYRFQLPYIEPLKGEYKSLKVHPYVLGAWLGDGTNKAPCITSPKFDLCIVDKIKECGYEISSQHIHKTTGVYSTYFRNLRKDLKEYDMCFWGKKTQKHIPDEYFTASIEQRLQLLAGLLDTDGNLRKKEHRYIFSTTDERLRDDFVKLVSTFNWRTCVMETQPQLSSSGIQGKKICWRIGFNSTMHIPCVVKRKQLFEFSKQRKISIIGIEKMQEKTEGNCITVEGGIYLVGNTLIPTHNSRTATLATQWLLGKNPHYKIMTCSYNEKLSSKFSKQVRNAIMQEKGLSDNIIFSDIFKDVKIKRGSASVSNWGLEGNDEDNYLATSPNGSATGSGADFVIIDDLIKNKYESSNADILDNQWEFFTDTIYSRLEGKRKILVIGTRWCSSDISGRLIKMFNEQGRKYQLITKKACENGKMLNEKLLSYEQYKNLIQTIGEDIVRANYDQEPIDLKGRLYEHLITYDKLPELIRIQANCDTADTGEDYLCSIVYGVGVDKINYILDVVYTKESMEITEKKTAKQYTDFNVNIAHIESNNGGRGFSRSVERICREELHNRITVFKPYTQTQNKQARILSNATAVELNVRFPKDWNQKFPEFYRSVTEYQREGKNAHDDAEDCLTSIVEKTMQKRGLIGA